MERSRRSYESLLERDVESNSIMGRSYRVSHFGLDYIFNRLYVSIQVQILLLSNHPSEQLDQVSFSMSLRAVVRSCKDGSFLSGPSTMLFEPRSQQRDSSKLSGE